MNGRIVEIEASTHQKVQKLLPWLLTETLQGAELAMVRQHVRDCQECRDDLEWQRDVQAARPALRAVPNVDRAFAAMAGQLDREPTPVQPGRPAHGADGGWLARLLAAWRGMGSGPRWAMALQCAIIAALALALFKPQAADYAQYRALSSAPAPGAASSAPAGRLMVVFKPRTTEAELRRILQTCGARIVDGPTVTDAYVLQVDGAVATALAALKREPAVTLVSSLDAGAGK
jgi:hypothetical protein